MKPKGLRGAMVDPPSGWRYGFPRRCTQTEQQTLEEWFLECGYPKTLIDQGMLQYVRYWAEGPGECDECGSVCDSDLSICDGCHAYQEHTQ